LTNNILQYEFKGDLPLGFEIFNIQDHYKIHKDIMIAPHRAEFYHILWIQKGTPTHFVDFTPIKLVPNSLLFINKGTVQNFDSKGNFEGKAIVFTDNFFCKTKEDIKALKSNILFNDLFGSSAIQLQKGSNAFTDCFDLMEQQFKTSPDIFQEGILRTLLHGFLLLAERERRKNNFTEIAKDADLDLFIKFKDQLDAQFTKNKQVSFYATKSSITEKKLNQITTKVVGKTPKQMIDDRIMLEAKRLLAHTTENIKEIGFSLGFEEPTNFIKYFKNHYNGTPVDFRESLVK
jgi:AraC-like DNA-binding protein